MFIGLCFIEGVATKRPMKSAPPRELVTDFVYWVFSPAFRVISSVMVAFVLLLVALLLGRHDAPRLVQGFGPLARQPVGLIWIESLIVSDLFSYWAHRTMHRVPWLWRFHAIHHSAKTIRWSTIGRVHPVNEAVNYAVGVLPCLALGLPLDVVLSVVPALMWWAVLAHSNFKLTWGPLGKFFVSPVFHRWHHTHSNEGGDSNFANVLSLWDRIFGSYYMPSDSRPEVFGLDEDDMPETYVGQFLYPFGLRTGVKPYAAPADSAASARRVPGFLSAYSTDESTAAADSLNHTHS
jgi:sterol desaturase/sphingolipid hydroxylase (fatty acid hydroxylase superfamily)